MSDTDLQAAAAGSVKPYPSAAAGWFLVVMLTVGYIFSFVDRYILGLLIEPIKAEFDLSDRSIGWLLSAFTLVYGFVGIFMGWLVDRGKRLWIVSIGVALWSVATVATGMAKNFVQLFTARMGVGIGEATLSPATFSMIGDSFPTEKRGKPIAFYSAALPIGAGLASLLSGAVIAWTASSGNQSLPFFGELSPWRYTMIIVGLPGLLLALFFLFMKEPVRRPAAASSDVIGGSDFLDALKYLWDNKALYIGFVLVICAILGMVAAEICLCERHCVVTDRTAQHDDHGFDFRLVDEKGCEGRLATYPLYRLFYHDPVGRNPSIHADCRAGLCVAVHQHNRHRDCVGHRCHVVVGDHTRTNSRSGGGALLSGDQLVRLAGSHRGG
jgi:hypothetical protein